MSPGLLVMSPGLLVMSPGLLVMSPGLLVMSLTRANEAEHIAKVKSEAQRIDLRFFISLSWLRAINWVVRWNKGCHFPMSTLFLASVVNFVRSSLFQGSCQDDHGP